MQTEGRSLRALVLGAAAGGGFPQWNCACRLCCLARAGDPRAPTATQASVAVSAAPGRWLIIGASPDLRQQILDTPALHPNGASENGGGARSSPIAGVVLLSADVDGIAGLIVLRERQPLRVLAPGPILDVLRSNSVFGVLDPALVEQVEVLPNQPIDCDGIELTLLPMPGKVPLYLEDRASAAPEPGPAFAARLRAGGRSVVVAPACAEANDAVLRRLRDHDVVFFDGTLFEDDEMIRAGVGAKTGRRMGHVPISGAGGSLERLASLPGRRIFIHINNTNPILLKDSPERRQVEAAGFEVGHDGMDIRL
jgi:pyrroloquinoline quinone biosynthesis protein B